MIENKIDAHFMPNQSKRYLDRAKHFLDRHESGAAEAFTLLLAPQGYNSTHDNDFNKRIKYEEILEYLKSRSFDEFAEKFEWALHRFQNGYIKLINAPVTSFFSNYLDNFNSFSNEVSVITKANDGIGRKNEWIYFKDIENKDNRFGRIIHKLSAGSIEVEVSQDLYEKQELINGFGLDRKATSKTFFLTCKTEKLDRFKDFFSQADSVIQTFNDVLFVKKACFGLSNKVG